jgi:hypothetical protein
LIDDFERTYKANIGSHKNKEIARWTITGELSDLIFMKITCRIGIEFANCECLHSGGQIPGEIEVNRISSLINLLIQYGGLSDEIKYDCAPSSLTISPMGDVLYAQDYFQKVFNPYASQIIKTETEYKANDYAKEFIEDHSSGRIKNIDEYLPKNFIEAWQEEFSFSPEAGFEIVDSIVNEGIANNQLILIDTYDSFITRIAKHNNRQIVESFLNRFSLKSRNEWTNIPSGYNFTDIYPWKYQRRLSLVTKGIVQNGLNLIIAPSLLAESYKYNIFSFYEARFNPKQTDSIKMRKWMGFKSNQVGMDFNREISDKLSKIDSMVVYTEVELTHLLNKKLDKDYGDIDVLAYHTISGILFVIECKRLQTARNPSEVSRQLYEFRGELRNNGKPDRLLKHINRIDIINGNIKKGESLKYENRLLIINEIIPCLIFSSTVPMYYSKIVKKKKIELIKIHEIEEFLNKFIGRNY